MSESGQGSRLAQEIAEQPAVIRRLLDLERDNIAALAGFFRERNPHCIVIAARGSSDNVARYAKYLLGAVTGLPVALATPSLLTVYNQSLHLENTLVIGISQSGQSPDIVAVLAEGARNGALTVAVTNDLESPLAQAAKHCINLQIDSEKSVAATKTYTASLTALAMLAAALDANHDRSRSLDQIPDLLLQMIAGGDAIRDAAQRYRQMEACVVIGRGYNYATAFEIALKLKELAYILAEPYSSADFWHGPVALVEDGFPVIAVVPESPAARELEELLAYLRSRGADLVVLSPRADVLKLAETPISLPENVPEWLSPIVSVVPGQYFALGLTLAKGLDPDRPRGLRKVTRTL
jgi:glucosamine--fructose-6-phosphate aminotransferase (isomerizing)